MEHEPKIMGKWQNKYEIGSGSICRYGLMWQHSVFKLPIKKLERVLSSWLDDCYQGFDRCWIVNSYIFSFYVPTYLCGRQMELGEK